MVWVTNVSQRWPHFRKTFPCVSQFRIWRNNADKCHNILQFEGYRLDTTMAQRNHSSFLKHCKDNSTGHYTPTQMPLHCTTLWVQIQFPEVLKYSLRQKPGTRSRAAHRVTHWGNREPCFHVVLPVVIVPCVFLSLVTWWCVVSIMIIFSCEVQCCEKELPPGDN